MSTSLVWIVEGQAAASGGASLHDLIDQANGKNTDNGKKNHYTIYQFVLDHLQFS